MLDAKNSSFKQEDDYSAGCHQMKSNLWSEARASFEAYLKDNPDHAEARDKLGLCLEQLALPQLALKQYTQAIEQDPTFWSAFHNRARLYLEIEAYDLAEKDLNTANSLSAKNPYILASLGECFKREQSYEKSIEYYQHALTAVTDPDDEFLFIIKHNMAISYAEQGHDFYVNEQFYDAIGAYTRSLNIGSPSELLLNQAGMAHFQLKEYRKAIPYFNQLIQFYREQKTQSSNGWVNRAECLYHLAEFKLAKGSLSIASDISPDDADIHELKKNIAAQQILKFYRLYKDRRSKAALNTTDQSTSSPEKVEQVDRSKSIRLVDA